MQRPVLTAILIAASLLTGCERLGIDSPEKLAALREADGKAVGGACRHAGRAIEDCYALNKKADRASVFAGWRDMNDYMRENKIDVVAPQLTTQLANAGSKSAAAEPAGDAGADKRSAKPADAAKAKSKDS